MGSGSGAKLPDVFGVTPLYEYLDVCRMFGQDPLTYHERLDEWAFAHLAEFAAVQSQLSIRRK